jgi:hypothetical protein
MSRFELNVAVVGKLAEAAQGWHGQRRARVLRKLSELREIGTSPAESSSRNPLEQPWTLTVEEAVRRKEILRFAQNDKRGMDAARRLFTAVRDETAALTEQIAQVEKEIDERVTALYGL